MFEVVFVVDGLSGFVVPGGALFAAELEEGDVLVEFLHFSHSLCGAADVFFHFCDVFPQKHVFEVGVFVVFDDFLNFLHALAVGGVLFLYVGAGFGIFLAFLFTSDPALGKKMIGKNKNADA